MKRTYFTKLIITLTLFVSVVSFSQNTKGVTTVKKDTTTTRLKYNFKHGQNGGLFLKNPSTTEVTFDKALNKFVLVEKIGDYYVSTPIFMTPREYDKYRLKNDLKGYFKEKIGATSAGSKGDENAARNLLPKYYVNSKFFESVFGSTEVDVIPAGQISIKLGGIYQNNENPQISVEQQSSFTFDFDQQISASLQAKIGTRLKASINYDTQSTFDFQNIVKLEYESDEDDILQTLDAGNISFPIKNSLINGAQSLFGVRADFQFGKTTIKTAFSQQKSESKTVVSESGGVIEEFELNASDYDNDRHFFLSQFFRETYDEALANYPLINSPVNITRIEVWVTNTSQNVEDYRSIVAFADIGETDNLVNSLVTSNTPPTVTIGGNPIKLATNEANILSNLLVDGGDIRSTVGLTTAVSQFGMQQGRDYSYLQNARKLSPNEYKLHNQLGYISLSRRLNDGEVLAVAYEYTAVGASGTDTVFKVGELSTDGIVAPDNLAVKLLRSEITNTETTSGEPFPTWSLMMKNIYAIGAYPLAQEGFVFELNYRDDEIGVLLNTLQNANGTTSNGDLIKEKTLMNLFAVDRLDQSQFTVTDGDGFFDYVEGITVSSSNGLIIFPTVEPFGEDLKEILTNTADQEKYLFEELYTTTKTEAKNNYQNKDKYFLRGYFKSESSSGISLGAFNIPRGSVTVTAGGRQLVEGVDYVVDYQLGRVQILDASIEASGTPVSATVENNTFFNQQQKTFIGIDVEHKISDDFILGATFLNVKEKPITAKINYGSEPINNVMLGLNVDYRSEVPFFTKLVNKLPFVNTDVASNLSVRGDFAYLLPGSPSGINENGGATAYLDDFEASQIPISLGSPTQWYMASTPAPTRRFSLEGNVSAADPNPDPEILAVNYKRAKLAWYNIDQLFYSSTNSLPSNIGDSELSRDEVRRVSFSELFPEQELDLTQLNIVSTLDLAYYPAERGPYNFNTEFNDTNSNPQDNWGGIMRSLTTNNFEQANVEYIEFWLMDPYDNYSITAEEGLPAGIDPTLPINQVGKLVFNLGNLSEDVLRDNQKQYENGLSTTQNPVNETDTSWGKVPTSNSILYAFSNEDGERLQQDVGLDGLDDEGERGRFTAFASEEDPAADNFQFFRGSELDAINASVLTRYKNYNNTQGNSPTADQSEEAYPTSATTVPDVEDINRDQTMNAVDSFYEYEISMSKSDLEVGRNFIVDSKITDVVLANGQVRRSSWYQFRIPVRTGYTDKFNISDFNSIRFMRMFLTDFRMPVVLRLGELELVRGDWRRYTDNILDAETNLEEVNNFRVGVVSVEENDGSYAVPPGIDREELQGTNRIITQNEQSATISVTNLDPGESRLMYKNLSIDMRRYKKLEMYLHAESIVETSGDTEGLTAVIRFGTDLDDNYYEIEKPLTKSTVLISPTPLQAWPEENNLEFSLEDLTKLKLDRDATGAERIVAYEAATEDGLIIRVKGSPTLAQIKTVMLGVKNDKDTEQSGEVWFNELRAVGFDSEGGWAGVVSANANFADVADISLTGSMSTVGFGSVESKVQERSLEDAREYNLTTNVQLGKMLPEKWNMQIPMNYSVSEQFVDPKFDPSYQDITVEDALKSGDETIIENSLNAREYTRRESISFINVKKNRNTKSKKKPKPYDVENISVSYSFSEEYHRDYSIEKYINQNLSAGIGYSFNFAPLNITPFKKSEKLKSKYWKFIRDININPIPSVIAINSKINRNYNEQQSRNLVVGFSNQPTLKQRNFLFDWDYTVGFDLTKSIQLNFNATNNYIYDTNGSDEELEIFDNFLEIGRANQYHQKLTGTYKLPINKLPYLNFITADYGYTADFDWQASSQNLLGDTGLTYEDVVGNMIQNANTHNLNANVDFNRFYKNIGLDKLFGQTKKISKKKKGVALSKVKKPVVRQKVKLSKNASFGKKLLKVTYDAVTSIKKAKISYSQNNGTLLQGYKPSVGFLGRDNYNGGLAPSLGFVFGGQTDVLNKALSEGWLVTRASETADYYNRNFGTTESEKLDYTITVKPFKNFSIDFRGNKIKTSAFTQPIDLIEGNSDFEEIQGYETGNYSTSHSMIGTVFKDSEVLFNNFLAYRSTISNRLGAGSNLSNNIDPNSSGFAGFKTNGQQSMLPAFLAAYSGKDPNKVSTGFFRDIPIPNWNLRYSGFMKLKWFKKRFSSFTLSHAYKSSYTLGSYTNNLLFDDNPNNLPAVNVSGNYQPELLVTTATLIDEFSPLIRLDMKMRNSFSFKGEIRRDRSLNLNFNNNTLTDVKGVEYIVGLGYKIKDVKFVTRLGGKKQTVKGDVNLRADISLRDNLTLIRSIEEESNQITGGENLFGLKFSADYNLSKNLTTSFYYNHNTFKYAISTSFPRQSINAGFNLIYNLGN